MSDHSAGEFQDIFKLLTVFLLAVLVLWAGFVFNRSGNSQDYVRGTVKDCVYQSGRNTGAYRITVELTDGVSGNYIDSYCRVGAEVSLIRQKGRLLSNTILLRREA